MPRPIATPAQFRALGLDADPILMQLYQGAYPRRPYAPAAAGFDVLVLCARELQRGDFPGVIVMRVPLNDNGETITEDEWRRAQVAGQCVAKLLRRGANVLTTCAAGRNRSGIVDALATYYSNPGMSGAQAARIVQRARPNALSNKGFVRALVSLP